MYSLWIAVSTSHLRSTFEQAGKNGRGKTKKGNLKQPTSQDAIDWVSKAWESIKLDTITYSFIVCGISNALDGSKDDLVSVDVPSIESAEERESAVTVKMLRMMKMKMLMELTLSVKTLTVTNNLCDVYKILYYAAVYVRGHFC